jgi:hypothetical protein
MVLYKHEPRSEGEKTGMVRDFSLRLRGWFIDNQAKIPGVVWGALGRGGLLAIVARDDCCGSRETGTVISRGTSAM